MATDADRTRHLTRNFLVGFALSVLALLAIGALLLPARTGTQEQTVRRHQATIETFYSPPAGWESTSPGTVLRRQPVGGVPAGSAGWRILYRTARADGSPAVSSGLVFAPEDPAPRAGRPLVAWAHPTVGMGDQCAPSRTLDPQRDIPGLPGFLRHDWVVTATDYAGLGTPGTEEFLVGEAEAQDMLNSVRAARSMPETGAGRRVLLWGHSQGGHATLFAQDLAPRIAPELKIIAAATAAPATELGLLFSRGWKNLYGSLIGSEVLVAWPESYSDLSAKAVTDVPESTYRGVAERCLVAAVAELKIRELLGQVPIFGRDPATAGAAWTSAVEQNTAPVPRVPTLVAQGLEDPVVLPRTTAVYLQRACRARPDTTALWIGDLGHTQAGFAAAPAALIWFQQRLTDEPADGTCGTDLRRPDRRGPPAAPDPGPGPPSSDPIPI